MSKILFIGDMHLKINRFELVCRFLSWLNDTIVKIQPDLVVNLGDTFDTHAVVRSEIMTEFMRHVKKVTGICPYVYLLGNHDMFKPNDAKYHALLHIKNAIEKLHIIDEVTEKFGLTFVPYQHDPRNFPNRTRKICIAHQTFKGADYGDITVKDGLDCSLVDAETIISGHIHKRQILGKVIYPGSSFSQSIGDINQVKGVMLFDSETLQYDFINAPLPMWRGAKFEFGPTFKSADLFDELTNILSQTEDHWVIEITGPKAEITAFLADKAVKKLFHGIDIKIKPNFTDKEKKITQITSLSIEGIVKDYIDHIYSGSLDRELLNSKSLELLSRINKA